MVWRFPALAIAASSVVVLSAVPLDRIRPRSGQRKKDAPGLQSKQRLKGLREAIRIADAVVRRYKEEIGAPGISVGVSVDGEIVWKTGYGYADLETLAPCTADSVMRIASISKSLTMAIVAKLMQENSIDLDAPIQKYVPTFPEKEFEGEKVCITTRQLVSHLGGIRHYSKVDQGPQSSSPTSPAASANQNSANASSSSRQAPGDNSSTQKQKDAICQTRQRPFTEPAKNVKEFDLVEYYNQKQFNSVTEALSMFKDDPLVARPGSKYVYTTHGWTLVSAVIEGASGKAFPDLLKALFASFGMVNTYLDENQPLIPNRVSYYRRLQARNFRLENVPWVNNTYKWAGGGVVSTVGDLLSFANGLLYFYHRCLESTGSDDCYLCRKTLNEIWKPVEKTIPAGPAKYAMGWAVSPDVLLHHSGRFYVFHTGGTIGATSVLLLKPSADQTTTKAGGVAVAVLANLQECSGMYELGRTLADIFDRVAEKNYQT